MSYINEKVYGLPKPLAKGHNTSPSKKERAAYVHKVTIRNRVYYKVHLKRQNISKIKYFKKKETAEIFVSMLKENKYL